MIFWYIYEFAFSRFQMGYALSAAMVLFLILITMTILQMRFLRADESDLGGGGPLIGSAVLLFCGLRLKLLRDKRRGEDLAAILSTPPPWFCGSIEE